MWWGEEAQTEKENQQFLYLDIVFATCVQLYAKSAFDVWMMLLTNDILRVMLESYHLVRLLDWLNQLCHCHISNEISKE